MWVYSWVLWCLRDRYWKVEQRISPYCVPNLNQQLKTAYRFRHVCMNHRMSLYSRHFQGCAWPRSPTEKLLTEMFAGRAAQFLAVLKALEDHNRRPLYQGPSNPKTELDQDTISDVYHVMYNMATNWSNNLLYYYYRNFFVLVLSWHCLLWTLVKKNK